MKQVAGRLRLDLAQYREMAAFAQFGSELDAATQSQLSRGQRMVELLKQDQYAPLAVEKQVLTIYAGTNGYLDDLDQDLCLAFEQEMHKYFDVHHANLLEALRAKDGLTDELKAALGKALDEVKEQFKAVHAAPA